ncbi:YqaE/Pmp3 family membrane protein [Parasphingorhabdus cellanae]|uniref:YqaE/Pmp3 family membrane protein n=1 Tax=Parasphingorhabdus cellanae TaxID=2806553 RepID=A0ABX7T307_9SPHN|nr:YqaE/Pmp3 family membrane protein [Parasphingorhabdus cellanae]QTD54932.1 YqaE/Pmp3 family membrane protein [Parasphingorhabdus cellanae]
MIILKILLAIILPPLGVFVQEGLNSNFWISVLLTLLGYVPGIVFALYILLAKRGSLA